MIVYRISKCKYIDDLTGYGAYLNGGRWNSKGSCMLYTSQSIALAMLEVLAHLPSYIAPDGFCLLTLNIPDDEIEKLSPKRLPENWNEYPSDVELKNIGNDFLRKNKKVALQVPSSVIEKEFNFLINPLHPNFKKIKINGSEPILIDKRLKS